ncbi:MAG: hypothetical protein A2X82_02540 [Geobacteraceae bacterium GWC2_55_20]|nr:MAG: hypothetical protein A2X82_02540 [Geobacteraceae bacterium GWC2_55_20]HBA70798.1 hypothetical protein [Geobacter sp.]HCE68086.1 hypothetical protein [Geobacter sp.]
MNSNKPVSYKQEKPVYYLGLLGNVDATILNLELGGDFSIERRNKQDIVKLLSLLFSHSELDVDCDIEDKFQYDRDDQWVYVISKEYNYWYFDTPKGAPIEEVVNAHHGMSQHDSLIKRPVRLLRLFSEGDIEVSISCFYRIDDDGPFLVAGYEQGRVLERDNRFSVDESIWPEINKFLRIKHLSLLENYLQLSFNQFEASYDLNDEQMAFLALNIALEILFNDGRQDISYKISRGTAALIGKTKDEALEIYRRIKKLYGKRSALVHSGDAKITEQETHELRGYVRRCLRRLFDANIQKDVLSEHLTISGFGRVALPKRKKTI